MLNLTDVALTYVEVVHNLNKQYFDHPAGLDTAIWNALWEKMYKTEFKPIPFLNTIFLFTNIFPDVKIIDV
jgi:hypothetical protein